MDLSARFYRFLFPSAIFETTGNSVCLTFDDGPHPVTTPAVLDILRQFNIRATFFVLGIHAREFPDIVKAVAGEGHSIGNHAFHHTKMLYQSKSKILENILRGNEAVANAIGSAPTLFRPPYGYYDYRVLKTVQSLGMRLAHWSHDTRDFAGTLTEASARNIGSRVTPGSILLLHDNEATASSVRVYLPPLLESLKSRDFTFTPLS